MYGLIGKMQAMAGERDRLATILLEAAGAMPGCLSFVVARDPNNSDSLWVTEVWESEAAHEASLALPAVRNAIAKGRPLIVSLDERHITEPIGGHGLKAGAAK
jgi:quinol monooxygenase YgiN